MITIIYKCVNIMTKKKRTIIGIIAVVLILLVLWWWYYVLNYEACIMFNVEEISCGGSCSFKSVITRNYCG